MSQYREYSMREESVRGGEAGEVRMKETIEIATGVEQCRMQLQMGITCPPSIRWACY